MSLKELYKETKLIETIENYGIAEAIASPETTKKGRLEYFFYDDENFWSRVIANPTKYWNQKIDLYCFVVSDWIARVPGLYWSQSAQLIRQHTQSDIAIESKEWVELYPPGKSKKVMGGIGTLLLPPTDDGKVLLSASAGCNASSGIPILFFPEILEHMKITQGDCINVRKARWQPMDVSWISKFPSTGNIPRDYLVIDSLDKVKIVERNCPISYHPFSLMEYEYQDSLFYDFVYLTADNKAKNVDAKIEKFFSDYAKKEGRHGEYLLNPNIVSPIFDARYSSPSELSHASEKANLSLLYERIRGSLFKEKTIEQLMIKIPQFYQSSASIKTLTKKIGLNIAFLVEDSAVSMSAQLISQSIKKGTVESLIDRISLDFPQIFI